MGSFVKLIIVIQSTWSAWAIINSFFSSNRQPYTRSLVLCEWTMYQTATTLAVGVFLCKILMQCSREAELWRFHYEPLSTIWTGRRGKRAKLGNDSNEPISEMCEKRFSRTSCYGNASERLYVCGILKGWLQTFAAALQTVMEGYLLK